MSMREMYEGTSVSSAFFHVSGAEKHENFSCVSIDYVVHCS